MIGEASNLPEKECGKQPVCKTQNTNTKIFLRYSHAQLVLGLTQVSCTTTTLLCVQASNVQYSTSANIL